MVRMALALAVLGLATGAWAQEDDDLAPLAPTKAKPAAKPAVKPKPAVRPPAPAKPRPAPPRAKAPDDDLAPLAPAATASLNLRLGTGPAGAVVAIDDKEVGTLPLSSPLTLPVGEHAVVVRRMGFSTYAKRVKLVAGKALELDVRLTPVSAVLSFTSDVEGAQVLVNGRVIGTTPIAEREWPPGTVELAIRKDGYQQEKQTVTLVAGHDYPVAVRMSAAKVKPSPVAAPVAAPPPPQAVAVDRPKAPPTLTPAPVVAPPEVVVAPGGETPLVQRWYFWVGVAAVAAAAVGVGVAVAQPGAKPRPLEFRDFCEGGVCPDACINVAMCSASFSGAAAAGAVSF